MDRRHVLAGFAAAVAASPALAQTTQTQSQPPMAAGGGMSRSGSMPDGQHQMGQAEMQHLQQTMTVGMVALETAKIAQEKGRNEKVKLYAKFERDEQEGISEVLRSMMEPMGTASTTAGAPPASPAPMASMQMDAKGREMVEKLRGMQSGAEFDRMFVEAQIMGHQQLLQIQEEYLRQGRNREHVNIAKLARGHIKEHIAEFQDLQRTLRS